MPRIPIPEYRSQINVPGVQPLPRMQPVPVSGAEADSLAALGQALTKDANVGAEYLAKFKSDEDKTRSDDAYVSQFGPAFRDLYNGYYSLQGKDALDQRPDFEKKMIDLRTQVRESLQNERQKQLFDTQSRSRLEGELDSMARHAAQERRTWMAKTSEAVLDQQSTLAADKWNDDRAFTSALQSGLGEVDHYGTSNGQSADMMRARGQAFVSKAWAQRIERVALQDPIAAREMYQRAQAQIAPEVRPILEHKIKVAVMPVEARAAADHIMTGADMQDLSRAIQTGDGSLLRVVERAQTAEATAAPTKSKDTRAMLASWVADGEAVGRKLYPDNPLFADMVVSVIKGRVATIVQAQEGVQRQAQEAIFKVLNDKKPLSVDALLRDPNARDAWTRLDEQTKHAFIVKLKGDADGESLKTNPKVMIDVFRRIHLDENDPEKIRSGTELAAFMGHGVSMTDYLRLQGEFDRSRTPEGNAFLKDVQKARTTMRAVLRSSIVGSVQPDVAEEAAYRAGMDLDAKIEQYRKDKKDPRLLLTPGTPDYALSPDRLQTFMPNARAATADAAAKARAADVVAIKDDADFAKLKSGKRFKGPDGIERVKP